MAIILENAGGGGANAAPVARQIMDFALSKTFKEPIGITEPPLQNIEQIQPLISEQGNIHNE